MVASTACGNRESNVTETNQTDPNRDVELLRRISEGDRSAFSEFYDHYSPLFFSVALRILNDHKEAEDVIQEVFLQIWEKAGNFDSRLGKPSSWGVTFVRNKSIDRIRSSVRRAKLMESAAAEVDSTPEMPSANETLHGRDKAELIRTAVTTLPQEQRQAIELAFFKGLTQHEISEKLSEPLGTIKARIRRGMMKLREKLEGLS